MITRIPLAYFFEISVIAKQTKKYFGFAGFTTEHNFTDINLTTRQKSGTCALCQRTTRLTYHHLIPRKLHRRKHFKKHYDKVTLQAGINICVRCHNGLHKLFDEMTLGKTLNTITLLQENPVVAKHCEWVSRQK